MMNLDMKKYWPYNFDPQLTTLPRNDLLCQLLGGLGSNEFHVK